MANTRAVVTMPDVKNSSLCFENLGARNYTPFKVYFDLEFTLKKMDTVRNNRACSNTAKIGKLKLRPWRPKRISFSFQRDMVAMTHFVEILNVLARDFHNTKRRFPNYLLKTVTVAGFLKKISKNQLKVLKRIF